MMGQMVQRRWGAFQMAQSPRPSGTRGNRRSCGWPGQVWMGVHVVQAAKIGGGNQT